MWIQITKGKFWASSHKFDFGFWTRSERLSESLFVQRHIPPITENPPPVMTSRYNCYALSNYTLWGWMDCHNSPHRRVRPIWVMVYGNNAFCLLNGNYQSRNQCSTLHSSFSPHIWVFPTYRTTFVMYLERRIRFSYCTHFCFSFSAHLSPAKTAYAPFRQQKMSSKWAANLKITEEMDSALWVL